MEEEALNPLYLIPPPKAVTVKEDDPEFEGIAAATKTGKNSYEIMFNLLNCQEIFSQSWASKLSSFKSFLIGLRLHEISHIIYDAFEVTNVIDNGVYHYIQNLLLDAQGEYSFTRDYPNITKYIRLILLVLKHDTDLNSNSKEAMKIKEYLNVLFYLVRFGVVKEGADPDFVNFVFPFILSATRKDVHVVDVVTKLIYQYLCQVFNDEASQKLIQESKYGKAAMTEGDLLVAINGQKIGSNDIITTTSDIKGGKFAAKTNHQIEVREDENAFFRQTVQMHGQLIQQIRKAFKLRLEKIRQVAAYDGDLNFKNQQSAYLNSFTGESGLDYNVFRRIDKSLDVVILRDVSGSTHGIHEEYCRLTIAILAALSDLRGINLAQIDFSDDALMNLNFNQPIRQSSIFPRVEGGTQILPAYDIVETLDFTAKKRIMITITDGYISNVDEYTEREKAMFRNLRLRQEKWQIGGGGYGTVKSTTLERFPADISKWLIGDL